VGFQVEVATNGLEGAWRAVGAGYDLIVLDVMLPGRNGYQICADLRRSGGTTPILMLTARDGKRDEAEGLDTGADGYVTKLFCIPVLVARIHAPAAASRELRSPEAPRARQLRSSAALRATTLARLRRDESGRLVAL
jgi:DNA-binding response OmpR family regulator